MSNKTQHSSVVTQVKQPEAPIIPTDTELDPTVINKSIAKLKEGLKSLKYGRRGKPHFRNFQLDEKNGLLRWKSKRLTKMSNHVIFQIYLICSFFKRYQRNTTWT